MCVLNTENATIGFIGTGVMGKSMAGHLMNAGYALNVYTRTRKKAQELVDKGASWKDSPAEVAADSNVVITIVGFSADVEEVYFGERGVLKSIREGSYVIDMTTSKPLIAQRIYAQAKSKGAHALDAPVSGGDTGAKNAALSIMVGADEAAFDEVLPLLQCMGSNIVLQGPAGSGQHAKMANQIAIAAGMVAVCESLVYAKKAGLDQETVLKSIGKGAAGSWSLNNLGPRMIQGNFAPGFYVKHFIKDMRIAYESATEMGLELPGLALAKKLYERLAESGRENLGTQGLYALFDT